MLVWNRTTAFYLTVSSLIIAAWLWLHYNLSSVQNGFTTCLFKNITGKPCPACGSTRSVISIYNGEWANALYTNPLGYIIFAGLVVLPIWIIADLAKGTTTLFNFLKAFDKKVKQYPILLIAFLLLILANWIWNLWKL